MHPFRINNFNRTGRAGIVRNIGPNKGRGASRATSHARNNSARHSNSSGNTSISSGPRSSNISRGLRVRHKCSRGARRVHRQDTRRRTCGRSSDQSQALRGSPHTPSGKENRNEGRKNSTSRMGHRGDRSPSLPSGQGDQDNQNHRAIQDPSGRNGYFRSKPFGRTEMVIIGRVRNNDGTEDRLF